MASRSPALRAPCFDASSSSTHPHRVPAGQLGGAVGAAVAHDHHLELAGLGVGQQRRQEALQHAAPRRAAGPPPRPAPGPAPARRAPAPPARASRPGRRRRRPPGRAARAARHRRRTGGQRSRTSWSRCSRRQSAAGQPGEGEHERRGDAVAGPVEEGPRHRQHGQRRGTARARWRGRGVAPRRRLTCHASRIGTRNAIELHAQARRSRRRRCRRGTGCRTPRSRRRCTHRARARSRATRPARRRAPGSRGCGPRCSCCRRGRRTGRSSWWPAAARRASAIAARATTDADRARWCAGAARTTRATGPARRRRRR